MPNTPTLPPELEKAFDEAYSNMKFTKRVNADHTHSLDMEKIKQWFAQTLETEVKKAVKAEKAKHSLKKCSFCKRKYRKETNKNAHESKCFKNPNRVCTLCDGSGLIDEVMNNGYRGHKNCPCPDCETAKQAQEQSL